MQLHSCSTPGLPLPHMKSASKMRLKPDYTGDRDERQGYPCTAADRNIAGIAKKSFPHVWLSASSKSARDISNPGSHFPSKTALCPPWTLMLLYSCSCPLIVFYMKLQMRLCVGRALGRHKFHAKFR